MEKWNDGIMGNEVMIILGWLRCKYGIVEYWNDGIMGKLIMEF
jgi:hypothetical protein